MMSVPFFGVSCATFGVRVARDFENDSSSTRTTATRIPGFTPSLSRSEGGFLILSAHFAAAGPSSNTAVPSGNVTRSAPSAASTFVIDVRRMLNRNAPRKIR
jgi:hypothetical protein